MANFINTFYSGYFAKELKRIKTEMGDAFDAEAFMAKGMTFLARHILLNLESTGVGSVTMGEGAREPSACVTIHYYSAGGKCRRLEIPFGGKLISVFCLDPHQERDKGGENGYSFEDALSEFLTEDALVSLISRYEMSLCGEGKEYFSPRAYLERRLQPGSTLKKDLHQDYLAVSESYYREKPDMLPGYLQFGGRDPELEKPESYTDFIRAASCMDPKDDEEGVFLEWRHSHQGVRWYKRHQGRSFTHLIIPVTNTFNNLIAVVEVFGLFPSVAADTNVSKIFENIIRWTKLSAWDISEYPAAEEFRRSTLSYALSSVMSRNLSHNIGSHVYAALTQEGALGAVRPEEGPYFGVKGQPFAMVKEGGTSLLEASRQMALLNSYIRDKMSYISEVSFRSPTTLYARALREEMIRDLDRTRLLLNHISGLGSDFRFQLDLRFRDEGTTDVQIAVPDHVVGTHALYNIMENVIRNVAKHGNSRLNMNVFTLEIVDDRLTPGMYTALLYHDMELPFDEAEKLVSMMNEKVAAPVLEGSALRMRDYGVIEMKASAAFLRQVDILHAVSGEYVDEPPLLEAVTIPSVREGMARWGYRFFLLKPRDYLVVTDEGSGLAGEGCLSVPQLEKALGERKPVPYAFLVYEDGVEAPLRPLLERYRTSLPLRIFPLSAFMGAEVDNVSCWQAWTRRNQGRWARTEFLNGTSGDLPSRDTLAVFISHKGQENLPEVVENELRRSKRLYLEALSSEAQSRLPYFHEVGQFTNYVGMLMMGPEEAELYLPQQASHIAYGMVLEAVNTSVFVLDERIQKAAYSQLYEGAPLSGLLELAGIHVPSPEPPFDLNAEAMDKTVCAALLKLMGDAVRENDFVILHYGLLERVFKREAGSDGDWFELMRDRLQEWTSQAGAGEIVVESGRGSMVSLPSTVRFLSYSSISYAIIDLRSKVALSALLHSARRGGK